MGKRKVNSQLTNLLTYNMYKRQMLTLAENVFTFEGLPDYIDIGYVNKHLVRDGVIAFFEDDILGLIALPFRNIGSLDVYNRPNKIQCYGNNGYNSKVLNPDDYVLMYDNNSKMSIFYDICQYAERIALDTRTSDINISQQKTPRVFKTATGNEHTIKSILNNVDAFENEIVTYDNINVDDLNVILAPAPFVADKIDMHKEKTYNEFLRLIGISSLTEQKKERLIRDEISTSQGGTIASRYSRFTPRQKACTEIAKKFGVDINVSFYDGLPTTLVELEEGVDNNVSL